MAGGSEIMLANYFPMSDAANYNAYWQSGTHTTKEWQPEYFKKHFGVLGGRRRVLDYGCGMGFG